MRRHWRPTTPPWGPEGITDADREAVSERLAAYHEKIATLLMTLNVETRFIK
jgi:hypothetical protein